ncbi:hypothetical protein IU485_26170 [Nocardia cyriacigeorgica]|uniref:DUF6879 domain-containing protein n=1 Tax=Nocardia cyriacigeorgica (strain GUH-2) TaxID=1127134 RepID=H6R7M2_NOCCG|nr:DUF6879 family protein [Nocardia cyriacigeorgica]MBF6084865.1 hypothetical protein [Nocardia cyriacigeorgica]MBF6092377.1 hypothetical protein [Nocardia cyriacigeorgica]BDT84444.1 hypothetical protein FMUAM8_02080 [Nocardia cyriacigeorgica]CCF61023.1 conserved protein of unknown function [Nocardia cyriacigeorgica GUH-2]
MQLLNGNPWPELFGQCRRDAFHLEVRDSNAVANESEPFRRFLDGEPDDSEWFEPWARLVRETTGRGVKMTRVRVVTVPHADYQRWLLALSELNVAAGEDIRYLPRHSGGASSIPLDDFWLLDDVRAVFNLVNEEGSAAGAAALTVDPAVVRLCRGAKERLWQLATPYAEYVSGIGT